VEKRKNIIVYFGDQQRYDTLGCYGQKLPVSPVLDEIAKEGVLFENAFTCQPVCGPARACMQTGKYPNRTGSFLNEIGLKEDENTIAKELGKAGYETSYVGKWHLSCDWKNGINYLRKPIPLERMGGYQDYLAVSEGLELTSHGYDGYVFDKDQKRMDFIGYRTDCITDYAIHYLHNKTSDAPFLLFISHIEPHQQNDRDRFEGPDGSKERFKDYEVPPDLLNGKYEGDWQENYPDYLGQCRKLDDNFGKLITTLKDRGLYEDTVIIYTSDHGCHFKTQEGEYKRNCFDSCLRIPLVITGGPFKGGIRCEKMVSNIQLPTTILALAGVEVPEDMAYPPLQEALREDCGWGEDVFYQISETELGRGIRTKKWKYNVHAPHVQPLLRMDEHFSTDGYYEMLSHSRLDSDSYIEQYLFDLEADPYEKNNLVDKPEYKEIRTQLAVRLCECMKKAGEESPVIYPYGTKLEKRY
jgi:arylsulfatase A-like enzyme